MKKLITAGIVLAFITPSAHAGWFGPSQEVIDLRNQVAQQLNALGFWHIVAGCLALFAIIAFITGCILGSRTRRNAQRTPTDEQ
jgi:hypothetical protein